MNDASKIWSVTEITQTIKELLENSFYPFWLTGEIGNLTIHRSGHVYLTLKDKNCQISTVFFRGADVARKMRLDEGTEVEVFGKLMVYEPRGNYQFSVQQLRSKGVGDLQRQFEELKQKLLLDGLFDENRKQKLPFLPRCIGVITSPDGAALHDFLQIIHRRFADMHIRIYPAAVQGAEAAKELVNGIEFFNRSDACDVIVLTRGGGSLEDLWAFNDEKLARAIFDSDIPVVSAVGHEVDFTISDFVADLRVPTPSAAAELVVGKKAEFSEYLRVVRKRMTGNVKLYLSEMRTRVERAANHPILREPMNMVRLYQQKVDELSLRLIGRLKVVMEQTGDRLGYLSGQLKILNPDNVLARGYSILLHGDEAKPVTDIAQVDVGSHLLAILFNGNLELEVKNKAGNVSGNSE